MKSTTQTLRFGKMKEKTVGKIKFKKEQENVIFCQNKNQLVSASAGSGKTTIMIQKIINLITLDKISIKNILVLTYTKASAEEMKQKLVSAIYEQVKTDKSLLAELDEVDTADISTIHSFFQKIITKYFMCLGINPSFQVIDETLGIKFQAEAMECAIQKFAKANKSQMATLLDLYGASRTTDGIKALVRELNRFLLAVPDAQNWQENVATKLYESLENNEGIKILNDELVFVAEHFVRELKNLQKECQAFDEADYIKYINAILDVLSGVQAGQEHFFENANLWQNAVKRQVLRQKEDVIGLYNKIFATKTAIKQYSNKIKGWAFANKEEAERELASIKPVIISLCQLTKLFQEEYLRIKTAENVMDFDDLEKYMLKLIENKAICEEIRLQYSKIFVDEYQDANRVQEKIIKAISQDNNRFMVGDVKQSIYGFRQAEPDIFLETLEKFSGEQQSEVGYLNYNFRSHSLILNFINIVFSKIMTPKTSKIDFQNTSQFRWDENYLEVEGQNIPHVEIDIIEKPEPPAKLAPTKIYSVCDENALQEEISDAELEAFFVAHKIMSLLGEKIYVAKTKSEREIEFKDITILLRSRGNYLDAFCKTLTALDIPLYANTNTSLFADADVCLLHNLLSFLHNAKNDIALVGIMHSVFGGFTFEELSKIRLALDPRAPFCECLTSFGGDEEILAKIEKLKKFLANLKISVNVYGVFKTLGDVLEKYGFYEYLLQKEDSQTKKENVAKFVNGFLTNGYNFDLAGFLDFVENNKADIKAPDYLGGENCVSITTMHSSKGLEYPVAIIANTNQNFDITPQNAEIKLNQTLGMGLKFYDILSREVRPSLAFTAIQTANKGADFAEKLRLLYVALSRPQNHLFIVGTIKKNEFKEISADFQTLRQNSFLKLIVNSLPKESVQKIADGQDVFEDEFTVKFVSGEYEQNFLKPERKITGPVDPKCVLALNQYFDFSVGDKGQNLNSSVTALREKFENIDFDDETQKNINNVEIGSAYHAVMEKIEFDKANNTEYVAEFLKTSKIPNAHLVDPEKIFRAISIIKNFGKNAYAKEIPFSMKMNLQNLDKNFGDDEIFVNGIVDLVCVGKKNILIDYKYTDENNYEKILNKYKLQLNLYQQALEFSGQFRVDEKYILLLKQGEILRQK